MEKSSLLYELIKQLSNQIKIVIILCYSKHLPRHQCNSCINYYKKCYASDRHKIVLIAEDTMI